MNSIDLYRSFVVRGDRGCVRQVYIRIDSGYQYSPRVHSKFTVDEATTKEITIQSKHASEGERPKQTAQQT